MKRKLAVPLAVECSADGGMNVVHRVRRLKSAGIDAETHRLLEKLADNRARIENLERETWACSGYDCSEMVEELEYLRATIELGLMEIAGGLDEVPSSEEILAEGLA